MSVWFLNGKSAQGYLVASPSNVNQLKLIIIITQRLHSFPRPCVIHVLSSSVPISDYITTLGVILDSNLTLNKHVSSVCKSARNSIKALRHIRPVLTCDMAKL